MSTLYARRSHGGRWLWFFATIIVAAALSAGAFVTFHESPPPSIEIAADRPGIGAKTTFTVKVREPVRGLDAVKIEVVQGQLERVLAQGRFVPRPSWSLAPAPTSEHTFTVAVGRAATGGLMPGEATIRVTAEHPGTWLVRPPPVVKTMTLPVRFVPPAISPLSSRVYVRQGGCEAVVYRVGPSSVRDGVEAGDWFFPGYPLPGAPADTHFALFAVPYDMDDASSVRLVAYDDVDNRAEAGGFIAEFFAKPLTRDTIHLTDQFMEKVVGEILPRTPELKQAGSLLESYLAINGSLRRQDGQILRHLARQSRPRFLWHQPFLAFANGKVMGSFGDHRTYVYQGKAVDTQDHLGFDLASVREAPVAAANEGVVVLARYLGIFGNAVVIDHGYGLMSLYAHLSRIEVAEGARVERGQLVARTGNTGLAAGDHLHFTMLLQGLPVTPVEWWDAHWIHDRLVEKLGKALPFGDEREARSAGWRRGPGIASSR